MSNHDAVRDGLRELAAARAKRRGVYFIVVQGHGNAGRRRLMGLLASMMGFESAANALSIMDKAKVMARTEPEPAPEPQTRAERRAPRPTPRTHLMPLSILRFPSLRERPKRRSIYSGRADKRSKACVKESRLSWSRKLNGVI